MFKANSVLIEYSAKFDLLKQLMFRDIMLKYKGSYLGILWSVVIPLVMLAVYTFVFSVVFEARWGAASANRSEYAILVFTGIIFFNVFSETIGRSPGLIIGNSNYVKKVVFPLEFLSIVALGNALIHSLVSLSVLLIGILLIYGKIHLTVLLLPFVYLPLIFFVLGISYFISSLGVFLRDINYFITISIQVLFFMTPIFYPASAVPAKFQAFIVMNPMSGVIDNARRILVFGDFIDVDWFISSIIISSAVLLLGYMWFKKTQKAFADVI